MPKDPARCCACVTTGSESLPRTRPGSSSASSERSRAGGTAASAWGAGSCGGRAAAGEERAKPERQQVLDSLTAADWAYLEALPHFVRLGMDAKGPVAVVHAGAVPGLPLEEQDPEHLLTMRSIRPDGKPSKK